MKYRVWLLVTTTIWVTIWTADLVQVVGNSYDDAIWDIAQLSILIGGMLAEVLAWRSAQLVNVGYFLVYGSCSLLHAFILERRLVAPSGEVATSVSLFALPMLAQAIVNFIVYRRRTSERTTGHRSV